MPYLKLFMPCTSIQKLYKPTTFTTIIGCLFTLRRQGEVNKQQIIAVKVVGLCNFNIL
jgi:hypothetical protein